VQAQQQQAQQIVAVVVVQAILHKQAVLASSMSGSKSK
jgi:hypothetical protein